MTAISEKYADLGGQKSFLGKPKDVERVCPDGIGRHRHFEKGSIHWSPKSGAHVTMGLIRRKWEVLGWELGPMGYPTSDEGDCPGGRFGLFQRGTILWRRDSKEAFSTQGFIRQKWAELGKETGFLGYPTTDERTCGDGEGKYQRFEGGWIYWHPSTGAHEVHGHIFDAWEKLGSETSFLGYPTTDELGPPGEWKQYFKSGRLVWSKTGVRAYLPKSLEAIYPARRRIRLTGYIYLYDDEFAGWEEKRSEIAVDAMITARGVKHQLMRFKMGAGGEIRGEMDLDVTLRDNSPTSSDCDVAFIYGDARFYEGTSENTMDLIFNKTVQKKVLREEYAPRHYTCEMYNFLGKVDLYDNSKKLGDYMEWRFRVTNTSDR